MSKWKRPSPSSLKLNTDEALKAGLGFVGLGVVIEDEFGHVQAAWVLKRDVNWDVDIAEMMAVKEDLVLARKF